MKLCVPRKGLATVSVGLESADDMIGARRKEKGMQMRGEWLQVGGCEGCEDDEEFWEVGVGERG